MQNATVGARQVGDQPRTGIREQAPQVGSPGRSIVARIRRLVGPSQRPSVSTTRSISHARPLNARRAAYPTAPSITAGVEEVAPRPAASPAASHQGAAPRRVAGRRAGRGWLTVPQVRAFSALLRVASLRARSSERALPVGVAVLILFASVVSFAPLSVRAVGGPSGPGEAPRLTIGGAAGVVSEETSLATPTGGQDKDLMAASGGLLEDGTLLKPVAVDTSVADGRSLVVTYTVQSGDTLSAIAGRFNINFATIWWANNLTSKDTLSIGQVLRIPTVNGIIVMVAEGDTIEGLAGKYGIDPGQIITVNNLKDPNLVMGQTLVLPGAQGGALPTTAPKTVTSTSSSTTVKVGTPTTYSGGTFAWPVVGGNNYISQYFRYGHYGLDIAADYGTPVVSGGAGTVIFAGWMNNGGGYQVWIAHGSNLYTTYNHMSAITVANGQGVNRGTQVGRIGMTGTATGPHLHFEVWIGPVWNGGYRVNPLNYL